MRQLKVLIIALVLAAAAGLNFAQEEPAGRIAGRIIDGADGLPIPGAWVKIEGTQIGARVNPLDGGYLIENIPSGKYDLLSQCLGYADLKATDILIEIGKTAFVDFYLTALEVRIDSFSIADCPPKIFVQLNKDGYPAIFLFPQTTVNSMPTIQSPDIFEVF